MENGKYQVKVFFHHKMSLKGTGQLLDTKATASVIKVTYSVLKA